MKKTISLLVVGILLASVSSCKKDLFDQEMLKKALEITFHNDKVDPNHTWSLIEEKTINVTANVPNVSRIEILSANPYVDTKVEILASLDVAEGDQVTMNYTVPKANSKICVAAVTTNSEYKVVEVAKGASSVDFSTSNIQDTGTFTYPTLQEVYYCYCISFPQPSTTWGYNDLVMSISKELINNMRLRVNVTLAALGNTSQMAGALRLDGINYEDVQSVNIVNVNTFNKSTNTSRTIIKDESLLLRGQDGSAVINLFDDAHMAFSVTENEDGTITRYAVNVSHTQDNSHIEATPVTVSYDITFKRDNLAQYFSYAQMDPFVLYAYNRNIWEIHKYAYWKKETLYSYFSGSASSYDVGFSWVLEIPYKWFRYPLSGNAMGSYKNGVLYGAYQQPYHSFGEWGSDMTSATDWYLYPSSKMVY